MARSHPKSFAPPSIDMHRILVKWSGDRIVPSGGHAHQMRAVRTQTLSAKGMVSLLFAIALLLMPVCAQDTKEPYRQTILTIQQHIEAKDLQCARALIANGAREFPADGGLENLLGVVEIQEGHTELAKQQFSLAIQNSPKLVSAYLNLVPRPHV
jgi:Flp pilus assembly protein TadD